MTIRGVLLDIGGVLYVGDQPVDGAREALEGLRAAGLALRFITNTTSSPKRSVLDKLARMGFDIEPQELFTPAAAARDWLAVRGCTPWLLVAEPLLEDFPDRDGEPDTVVIGDAGPGFTYEALNRAFRLIMDGAPLIALAKNRYFMQPDGLTLDAGAFVTALEFAAGVEATVLGKPAPDFFIAALSSIGCPAGEAVMIGDDWESDVDCAMEAGLGGILVKTGKYAQGDEAKLNPGAEVAEGIAGAVELILRPL
ncbi:MAG: TIGR01458 family HAD-type hydrolase [Proteobacteria bacterium]|nr:TIGR01458 family HAD-type hydrolase [Pseudomonadota bacterium]